MGSCAFIQKFEDLEENLSNKSPRIIWGQSGKISAMSTKRIQDYDHRDDLLAIAQDDPQKQIRLWNITNNRLLCILTSSKKALFRSVDSMDFSNEGDLLVVLGRDITGKTLIVLWDLGRVLQGDLPQIIFTSITPWTTKKIMFYKDKDRNEDLFLTCGGDNVRFHRINLRTSSSKKNYNVNTGSFPLGHFGKGVTFTDMVTVGTCLFVSSSLGQVFRISMEDFSLVSIYRLHDSHISHLLVWPNWGTKLKLINPQFYYLSSVDIDGILRIWLLQPSDKEDESDHLEVLLEATYKGPVQSILFCDRGLTRIDGKHEGQLRTAHALDWRLYVVGSYPNLRFHYLQFHVGPSSSIYDAWNGKIPQTSPVMELQNQQNILRLPFDSLHLIDHNRFHNLMASTSKSGNCLIVWKLLSSIQNSHMLHSFPISDDERVASFNWHPADNRKLAVGFSNGSLKLFDWENRICEQEYPSIHSSPILCTRYSKLGEWLFTVSSSKLVRHDVGCYNRPNMEIRWKISNKTSPLESKLENSENGFFFSFAAASNVLVFQADLLKKIGELGPRSEEDVITNFCFEPTRDSPRMLIFYSSPPRMELFDFVTSTFTQVIQLKYTFTHPRVLGFPATGGFSLLTCEDRTIHISNFRQDQTKKGKLDLFNSSKLLSHPHSISDFVFGEQTHEKLVVSGGRELLLFGFS